RDFHVTGVQTCALPISPLQTHPLEELRTFMRGSQLERALEALKQDGYMHLDEDGRWGLTPSGVAQAEAILRERPRALARRPSPEDRNSVVEGKSVDLHP